MNRILKKIVFFIIYAPILFGCKQEKVESLCNTRHINNYRYQKFKKIIFKESVFLIWDIDKSVFVKDKQYLMLSNNKNMLSYIVNEVSNTEDLGFKICSKSTSNAKKGDIAFLYLLDTQNIFLFSCFKIQFDIKEGSCPFPKNLLDYVENNRKKVTEQIKKCLKK